MRLGEVGVWSGMVDGVVWVGRANEFDFWLVQVGVNVQVER